MKIQNLAVIFIVIILPISMVLTSYTHSQMKTLDLQISYDTKLDNATYDALKAFQLNTINNTASDLANSKLQDIEASVNTFFNSISTNFNMAGYNQDALKHYVPALVYTMYDGYYIYSPYTNTLTANEASSTSFQDREKIYGLKPYIHYSCRYKKGNDIDVVITYSLDNYITVQGKINDEYFYKYGYLLDNIDGDAITNYDLTNSFDLTKEIKYRNVKIEEEELKEYINKDDEYTYVKINGQKYYEKSGDWYSSLNGEVLKQGSSYNGSQNRAAKQYYLSAYDFSKWVKDKLGELTDGDAVTENGNTKLTTLVDYLNPNEKIFKFKESNTDNISIEDTNSNFNQHRLAIIRYSIEKNLSIAIANYNNYSEGPASQNVNFQMPKLKEDEWTKIINNVSIISFLQGLNIGGKVYNGYSIITNTETQEVVNEESIYLADNSNYYRITDSTLNDTENYKGFLNTDFKRRTNLDAEQYFFPKKQLGSYTSIVNQTAVDERNIENIYTYIDTKTENVKKAFYTALGRERYSMYRTNNDIDSQEMKDAYGITP